MISIITPAYNAEPWIREAIASVQAQTRTDWELIVIDDGSIDCTRAIAESVNDPKIRVLHQKNAGVSAARNFGLDVAQGRYITFMDADDRIPCNALELRADLLDRDSSIDIVHGGVRILQGERAYRLRQPDLIRGPLIDRLVGLEEGVFTSVCYMLRREKIGAHRFQAGLSHCEDLIFFLELAHDEDLQYAAVPEVVYDYRVSPGTAMSNLDGLETGYLELLRRVGGLKRISEQSRVFLGRKIERILFRSWLRRGKIGRAIRSRSLVAEAVRTNGRRCRT